MHPGNGRGVPAIDGRAMPPPPLSPPPTPPPPRRQRFARDSGVPAPRLPPRAPASPAPSPAPSQPRASPLHRGALGGSGSVSLPRMESCSSGLSDDVTLPLGSSSGLGAHNQTGQACTPAAASVEDDASVRSDPRLERDSAPSLTIDLSVHSRPHGDRPVRELRPNYEALHRQHSARLSARSRADSSGSLRSHSPAAVAPAGAVLSKWGTPYYVGSNERAHHAKSIRRLMVEDFVSASAAARARALAAALLTPSRPHLARPQKRLFSKLAPSSASSSRSHLTPREEGHPRPHRTSEPLRDVEAGNDATEDSPSQPSPSGATFIVMDGPDRHRRAGTQPPAREQSPSTRAQAYRVRFRRGLTVPLRSLSPPPLRCRRPPPSPREAGACWRGGTDGLGGAHDALREGGGGGMCVQCGGAGGAQAAPCVGGRRGRGLQPTIYTRTA